MKKKLLARLTVSVLSAAGIVISIQSASTADSYHCTQYPAGQACIHELLAGKPGGSIITARFYNNAGSANNAATQLWATDLNYFVGQYPGGAQQYLPVPLNTTLDYGNNFMPLGHGTCHTYQAKIQLKNGNVLTSPKETYCYNDTTLNATG